MTDVEKELTDKINAEHRACETVALSTMEHAIRAGELLAEAKNCAAHGNWGSWLLRNFEGSSRNARIYTKLYHRRDALGNPQHAADMSIREVLRELESRKDEPGLSEDRVLWSHISLTIEDHPTTFLFDGEIPLVIKRLRNGPKEVADAKLVGDYRTAFDNLREATTHFEHLSNTALVGWRIKRAIGAWVTTVVMESGDLGLQPPRLRWEANVAELETNHPEAWEVFWHVTVK